MEDERNVKIGDIHTIEAIELSLDAKYLLTVTDGTRNWRLKWNRKKLGEFRDSLASAPKVPVYKGIKKFKDVTWIFSEKAEADYEKLMSLFNGPTNL